MNEREERREQELAPTTPAEIDKNDPKTIEGSKKQNRRMLVWVACGLYLLYLSYSLIKGLVSGEVDTTSGRVISIVACVLFISAAVYLLIQCIRTAVQSFRDSVSALEEAEETEQEENARKAREDAAFDDDEL